MNFFQRRKYRKAVKHLVHAARHVRYTREDIAPAADIAALKAAEDALLEAWKRRDAGAVEAAGTRLQETMDRVMPKGHDATIREWVEIVAVALAIAMAFRAYVIQPFKIPTGSMMPTLCGIRMDAESPGQWYDKFPVNMLTRFFLGERYVEIKSPADGVIVAQRRMVESPSEVGQGSPLGFVTGSSVEGPCLVYQIDGAPGEHTLLAIDYRMKLHFTPGETVKAGQLLASGRYLAGDHLFVNRIAYNFRKPHRQDIFVFNTRDLKHPDVRVGEYYIKRLVGLPGESIAVSNRQLVVNGAAIPDPRGCLLADSRTLGEVSEGHGYENPELWPGKPEPFLAEPRKLGPTQYLPMGDNTRSSLDGRYFGPVERERIVGPAFFVYWPFGKRWGTAK